MNEQANKNQRVGKADSSDLSEKIADADHRGNVWLSRAREAEERGNKDRATECYRKGQYWLDRSNKLRGQC